MWADRWLDRPVIVSGAVDSSRVGIDLVQQAVLVWDQVGKIRREGLTGVGMSQRPRDLSERFDVNAWQVAVSRKFRLEGESLHRGAGLSIDFVTIPTRIDSIPTGLR